MCIDNSDKSIRLTEKQIQFLCDRNFGVGADGVTLACGTGASASFAHILKKYPKIQNEKVEIKVPGGTLFFEQDENKNIFMTGLSFIVFEGKIEV
ncbi:TPA: hypothetical protein EYG96_00495 [Candidatus Gracilibacteria bacterium]|nr:hypothetical protein [Candidatus Gracilibacteria bacterium]